MKVSLIPIGAYKPHWFMSPIHVSPEEAIKIHLDVKSERSIAMHFGTFPMADDGQYDPLHDLEAAMQKQTTEPVEFMVLKAGEVSIIE